MTTPRAQWCHEVRESLRQSMWRRVADRRPQLDGIQAGVDRFATCALLRGGVLTDMDKGILRS
eukprot:10052187-Karenia_brevis.AAC.1